MKREIITFAAPSVILLIVLWRMSGLNDELSELRNALTQANRPQSGVATAVSSTEAKSGGAAIATSENPGASRLDDLEKRLDALENTVGDLADAWNRFAADEQEKRKRQNMRGWGPEQATGAPNTPTAGDQPTAWASQAPDGGSEWLETSFDQPTDIARVGVVENYCPGAVVRIAAILDGGTEVTLWEGQEPPSQAPAHQWFPSRASVVASKVRVYLDTAKVPGWNEIDAVEIVGRDGTHQWASEATASSTYAQGTHAIHPGAIEMYSRDLLLSR